MKWLFPDISDSDEKNCQRERGRDRELAGRCFQVPVKLWKGLGAPLIDSLRHEASVRQVQLLQANQEAGRVECESVGDISFWDSSQHGFDLTSGFSIGSSHWIPHVTSYSASTNPHSHSAGSKHLCAGQRP